MGVRLKHSVVEEVKSEQLEEIGTIAFKELDV